MEGMDLNFFQNIFTTYSETSGYNANLFLLFILVIVLGIIYTYKFGTGEEGFFNHFGTTIISFIFVGFFTVYIIDVKGLNEKRKIVLNEQEIKQAEDKQNYIDYTYNSILENSNNQNPINKINEVSEYLLKNDVNAIEKIERIYDPNNVRLTFLLMKSLKNGTSNIFKDNNKYEFYKDLLITDICPNNLCSKENLNKLSSDDIDYLRENSFIFDKNTAISFLINIGYECDAALSAYSISKEYGNKLAKEFNCTNIYNKHN